ncbi:MAG: hypothetical protein WA126_00695 [Thermodesulfovibrionales bacterium]
MKRTIFCLAILCILLSAIGCGGGGGGNGTGKDVTSITLSASFKDVFATDIKAKATSLTQIRYRVSGPGMDAITGVAPISNNLVQFQLKVPNGLQRHFMIEALDKDNRVRYAGDARRDLIGEPVTIEITLINNLIIGTWGYVRLEHENTGAWSTKAGKITFNIDGSGLDAYQYNDNTNIGTLTEIFTFTTIPNQDGSFTVNYTIAGGSKKTRKYIISDNAQMMVMDGTDESERQRLRVFIKMDSSKTYSNADVIGDYYTIGYEHATLGANWPSYYSWSGITTFNGNGEFQTDITINADNIIIPDHGIYTYSVNPDGSTMDNSGYSGYLTADGKIGVLSRVTKPQQWSVNVAMRKADRTYSTADLAGTWVVTGFGEALNGNNVFSYIQVFTCNSNGECEITTKRLTNKRTDYVVATDSFVVSPDGSYGASFAYKAPSYAGALGNNGNTIILNRSFNPAELYVRRMSIGVKCSTCTNIITGLTGLSGNWLFYRTTQGETEEGPFCETITQTIGTGDAFAIAGEFKGSGSINGNQVQMSLNVDCGLQEQDSVSIIGTTDGNTMNGTFSMNGPCGNVSGTCRAIRGECIVSADTGLILEATVTPAYRGQNTYSVDAFQQICSPGPPPAFEFFGDHQASVTITARLRNPNTTNPPGNLTIEKYTVDYARSADSPGAPPIASDTRYRNIVIPQPTGTGSTTVTDSSVFLDLLRKAKYENDITSEQFSSGPAFINNYTATYTFQGKTEKGEVFSFKTQTDFQIGSFDYCQ